MVKDGSDNAEFVRMYAGLALLVVAILVLSTLVASSFLARDMGSGNGDTGAERAGAEVMDVGTGGENADGAEAKVTTEPGTTTPVEPADGPAGEPQGPLVEDEATGEILMEVEKNLYVAPKEYDSNGMRRVTPGSLDWKYDTPEGEELSTPGLVDLNGDGTHEVVFASHGDAIYALSHSGNKKWVNTENVIEQADDGHFGWLDFEPPPIFSSVTPADIDGSSDPEILVGVEDGIVCLNADGSVHWKKGLTDGYYFSTPTVTDLEGEFTGDKNDLEVVLGSDHINADAYLEAFHIDGGSIFRFVVTSGVEPALLASSPVAQDLDGSFYDPEDDPPEPDEEVWHELELGSHDHGMRVYAFSGLDGGTGEPKYNEVTGSNLAGHQTYATSAVGNFTMNNNNAPEEYEIIVGTSDGYLSNWESWEGYVESYDGYGNLLWSISTGPTPASVFASPAVADVQMAELDEAEEEVHYEIFYGTDSGKVGCLDADYRQELWSYTTGGRVLSSPAIANIDSDDELEVIIGSNDGYVYAFDGDPSDNIDEGMADGGGSSGAYDILWKYATGGQGIGISSPVVGDIDNDNVLEVVVGDIGGTVYCIEAGTSSRGQIDWPMFHYDLNKTGFYKPRIKFGVDLSPAPVEDGSPDSMIKSAEPGESVYYNVTIRNTGSGVGTAAIDTFYVSLEGEKNNPGWTGEVVSGLPQDNLGRHYVTLEVDEKTTFVVRVTAPYEGSIGEVAQFNVTANSTNDPFVKDVLITSTQLVVNLEMKVEVTKPLPAVNDPTNPYNGEKWARVDPGGEYVVTLELKNTGNLNDTYDLRLMGVTQGWEAVFVSSETGTYQTHLTASMFAEQSACEVISIRVRVPFDAQSGESSTIVVKATSLMSRELLTPGDDTDWIEAQDHCVIEAGATNELGLEAVDPVRYTDPGGSAEFLMYVTNRGNRQMSVEFDHQGLEGRPDEDDWDVSFTMDGDTKDETVVASGQKKELRVEVVAPRDARADLRLPLTISAVDPENPNILKTQGITTIVRHVHSLNASVTPRHKTVDPGGLAVYRIAVVNEGNGEDIARPTPHSVPMGWDVHFTHAGKGDLERRLDYPVGYGETVRITMYVQTTADVLTAEYPSVINISGGGTDNTAFLDIVTEVNQTYDLRVMSAPETADDAPAHHVNATMDPGSTRVQRVMVTNLANGPDDITFTAGTDKAGWSAVIGGITNTGDYTPNRREADFSVPLEITNKGELVTLLPDKNSSMEDTVRFSLGVGETAWVQVVITASPDAADSDSVEVLLSAESSSPYEDGSDNGVIVSVDVDLSDLKFTKDGIKHPAKMKEGRIYTINAKIINAGDIEARDFWVAFYVDGEEVDRIFISRLIPARTQIVAFTWSAEGGTHRLMIRADADDTVTELDEGNNEVGAGSGTPGTNPIEVEKSDASDQGALETKVVAVVFVVLLILLLLALGYMSKRYRDMTKRP